MSRETRQLQKIVAIVGPTAAGKSDLAATLAKKFNSEVISADSRQVYRGLDIGSGKITKREMRGVPHHLLDVANPKRTFTAAGFKRLGERAIADILACGKLPIIAGGTGFYVQALVDGVVLPGVPPSRPLRKELEKESAEMLLARLKRLDPGRFSVLVHNTGGAARNKRRLIRAIEVATALGKVPNHKNPKPKYDVLFIGLDLPDDELRRKIHARLHERMKKGMIAEVGRLHEQGVSWKRFESLGLEYRYFALYLQGKLTKGSKAEKAEVSKAELLTELLTNLEAKIWQYAKRQRTWFRRDPRVTWLHPDDSRAALKIVAKFLGQ